MKITNNKKVILSAAISALVVSVIGISVAGNIIHSEKIKIAAEYDKTFAEYQNSNIFLDYTFGVSYFNNEYKKFSNINKKINDYLEDINAYKNSLIANPTYDGLGESILSFRAYNSGVVSMWIIIYSMDMAGYFIKLNNQNNEFEYFNNMLNGSINSLDFYIKDLNNVITMSEKSSYGLTYSNLRDTIREAKNILENLRADIQNRHKIF